MASVMANDERHRPGSAGATTPLPQTEVANFTAGVPSSTATNNVVVSVRTDIVLPETNPSAPQSSDPKASSAPQATETTPPATPSTHPVREISFSVSQGENQNVEVRLADRAGRIHVAVRTTDPSLSSSLRSDLGDLVTQLGRHGISTDVWTPSAPAPAAGEAFRGGDNRQASPQNSGGQGGQGSPSHQQSRQQPDRQAPDWLEELENELQEGRSN